MDDRKLMIVIPFGGMEELHIFKVFVSSVWWMLWHLFNDKGKKYTGNDKGKKAF